MNFWIRFSQILTFRHRGSVPKLCYASPVLALGHAQQDPGQSMATESP